MRERAGHLIATHIKRDSDTVLPISYQFGDESLFC